ncbi:MAG: hypothetical protein ABW219_11345 [Ilumatobacteraceae bacterium]
MSYALIAVAVVLIVVAVVILVRRRRPPDGVATFRRQIEALSPEARRPVVDRLHQLDEDGDK